MLSAARSCSAARCSAGSAPAAILIACRAAARRWCAGKRLSPATASQARADCTGRPASLCASAAAAAQAAISVRAMWPTSTRNAARSSAGSARAALEHRHPDDAQAGRLVGGATQLGQRPGKIADGAQQPRQLGAQARAHDGIARSADSRRSSSIRAPAAAGFGLPARTATSRKISRSSMQVRDGQGRWRPPRCSETREGQQALRAATFLSE